MENFRRTLKRRILLSGALCLVLLALLLLNVFRVSPGADAHVNDFISGYNAGFTSAVLALTFVAALNYLFTLRNEQKLKKLYITETDERSRFINAKIGGMGMNLLLGGLCLGTIAAGYFNATVFFTLLGTVVFATVVKLGLLLVYSKKY